MTKKDFLSHFYEAAKRDIVGVIDETLRFYDSNPLLFYFPNEDFCFSFKLRLETCSFYVRRPVFSNLFYMAYTIIHYMDFIPPSAFSSPKVSPHALLLINLFYEFAYVGKKNNSK